MLNKKPMITGIATIALMLATPVAMADSATRADGKVDLSAATDNVVSDINRELDQAASSLKEALDSDGTADESYQTSVVTAMMASKLIDARVSAATNDPVGEVEDVLITSDGSIKELVVDLEPLNDVPNKDVAVTFSRAIVDADSDGDITIRTLETKPVLSAAPEWQLDTEALTSVSAMIGSEVKLRGSDDTARVQDVIISEAGVAQYAVLSHGGVIGLGDKLVAVPLDMIAVSTNGTFSTPLSSTEIESMLEFRYRS